MSRRDDSTRNAPSEPDDFEQRLNAKLEARRAEDAKAQSRASGWAVGLRYGSEFIGGVIAGTGVGFLVDRVTGWTPWGLLIGAILGFAAGTLNIVRAARSISSAHGEDQD